MTRIGLLDCNNFFVSCERLFRPDLSHTPVVVLSSNDGCVVARSEEVKAAGIPMGIPYFKVKQDLAKIHTTIFSSNFALYRDISARVMQVLGDEVPACEQYSIDEAFFSVPQQIGDPLCYAEYLRDLVLKKVGVPVSVGIGATKTIAKLASKHEKRRRCACVLLGADWYAHAPQVLLSDVWGVGGASAQAFRTHGIVTVEDLLNVDRSQIASLFGIHGLRLQDELNEEQRYPLHRVDSDQKSIMSTRSFDATTQKRSVIDDAVAYHVNEVAQTLRRQGLVAGSIEVVLSSSRYGDYALRGGRRSALLLHPTSDTRVLMKEAHELVSFLFETDVPYKKAGVVLTMLRSETVTQQPLFEYGDERREQSDSVLMNTIDTLNARMGRDAILIGRTSVHGTWEPKATAVSPSYTTRWHELPQVRA